MGDTLYDTISRSVVAIAISEYSYTDGIVLVANPEFAYIIAHPRLFEQHYKYNPIRVVLPNNNEVLVGPEFVNLSKDIVVINCHNPTPGIDYGLEALVGIDLSEQIEEHEEVYTYSNQINNKILTPGRISLVEDETFDHNCGADKGTDCGAPVVNQAGQLVGMCISYEGYLTARKTKSIAAIIEEINDRTYTSVEAAVQDIQAVAAVHQNKHR